MGTRRRLTVALDVWETDLLLNRTARSHRGTKLGERRKQVAPTLWLNCGHGRPLGLTPRINRLGLLHSCNTEG